MTRRIEFLDIHRQNLLEIGIILSISGERRLELFSVTERGEQFFVADAAFHNLFRLNFSVLLELNPRQEAFALIGGDKGGKTVGIVLPLFSFII